MNFKFWLCIEELRNCIDGILLPLSESGYGLGSMASGYDQVIRKAITDPVTDNPNDYGLGLSYSGTDSIAGPIIGMALKKANYDDNEARDLVQKVMVYLGKNKDRIREILLPKQPPEGSDGNDSAMASFNQDVKNVIIKFASYALQERDSDTAKAAHSLSDAFRKLWKRVEEGKQFVGFTRGNEEAKEAFIKTFPTKDSFTLEKMQNFMMTWGHQTAQTVAMQRPMPQGSAEDRGGFMGGVTYDTHDESEKIDIDNIVEETEKILNSMKASERLPKQRRNIDNALKMLKIWAKHETPALEGETRNWNLKKPDGTVNQREYGKELGLWDEDSLRDMFVKMMNKVQSGQDFDGFTDNEEAKRAFVRLFPNGAQDYDIQKMSDFAKDWSHQSVEVNDNIVNLAWKKLREAILKCAHNLRLDWLLEKLAKM